MTKIYTDENNNLCVESSLIRQDEYNTQFVNGWLGYNQGSRWLFQIMGVTFSIRKQKELPSLSEIFVEFYKAKLDTSARKNSDQT